MKITVRAAHHIEASKVTESTVDDAKAYAQTLKFILDDMDDSEYERSVEKCPQLYAELEDFIRFN